MKIAFDSGVLDSVHGSRGVGVYARELIRVLGSKVDAVDFTKADLSKYDLAHIPFFNLFSPNPNIGRAKKTVLTVHDVTPLLYPKHYPPGLRGSINLFFNRFLVNKTDAIITDTQTSKTDITKYLGVPPNKIHVTYLGVGKGFRSVNEHVKRAVTKKFKLPSQFVFYFGDINYNKNIPTLIKVCKTLGIRLVIAGKQASQLEEMDLDHAEHRHLKEVYKDLTDPGFVTRAGFVTDQEASAMYGMATVYVQPSYYEGFGLSVLHAFAVGCPVVASNTPALFEIGRSGALFADPNSSEDFTVKVKQVIENKELRNQLIDTAKVVVKNFSWEKTAKETLKVYESL